MPISFEQAQPLAPEINARFGAAQQYSQDAPTIQRGVDSIAGLYEQQAQMAQQANLQERALRAQAADSTARIQAGNDARAANAADSWRGQLADMNHQSGMQAGRLDFAAAEGNANRQQSMIDMQEHAALQNWLGQQEMSQAEQMRLQRQQNAIGEVMGDTGLSAEEKTNYVRQLKTGIDVGKQRLQQTQQKQNELENQRLQQQLQRDLQARALEAKTLPDRTQTIYDQNMTTSIQPGVEAEFDKMFPDMGRLPGGQQIRAAAIQKEVWERVAAAGGATQYIQDSPGKFTAVKHPKDEKPEMTPFDEVKSRKQAEAIAASAFPEDTIGTTGKPQLSEEQLAKRNARIAEETNKMRDQWTAANQQVGRKEGRKPWAGIPAAEKAAEQAASASPAQQQVDPKIAEYQKKIVEENKPFTIGEGNAEQNKTVKYLDDIRASLRRVPGLDEKAQSMFEDQAGTAIQLISRFGSKPAMPPQEQQLYGAILESLKRLAPKAPPRDDQKEPPKKPGFWDGSLSSGRANRMQ